MKWRRHLLAATLLAGTPVWAQPPVTEGITGTAADSGETIPVIEVPRGWIPQWPVLPTTPWWHMGLRATSQFIGNATGGQEQTINLANQIDLTSSLGTGLGLKVPRQELDRWSLNTHLSAYVSSGDFDQQLGFRNQTFKPQGVFQSPPGIWMQGLWFERVGKAGELLQSLKFGDVTVNPTFFKPPAGTLYISNVFNGHSGIETAAYPYGPLNALGAMASFRLGRSQFDVGAFQLNSQRSNPSLKGFNQSVGPQDGVLQVLQWQHSLTSAQHAPGCAPDLQPAKGADQPRFRTRTGCEKIRLLQNQLPDPMVRLGAYSGSWSFAGVNGPSLNGMAPSPALSGGTHNNGAYGYLALPLGERGRVWLNGSVGFDPAVNPFPGFLAGGLVQQGLIRSRPEDLLVLGIANAWASPSFNPAQSNQGFIELSYQLQLSDRLSLQPFSQLLLNPGGTAAAGVLTLGIQFAWSL